MKSKNSFKFNHNLETYEERLSFIEENRKEIAVNNLLYTATDYLLGAKDNYHREIEYSYYIRDRQLNNSSPEYKTYNKLKNKYNESENLIMTRNTMMGVIPEGVLEEFPDEIQEDIDWDTKVNNLFAYRTFTVRETKESIKSLYPILEELSENTRDMILFLYDSLEQACKNEKDIKYLQLLSKGLNQSEIAVEANTSRQEVSRRLNKIIKNAKILKKSVDKAS